MNLYTKMNTRMTEGAKHMYHNTAAQIGAVLLAGTLAGCTYAINNGGKDQHNLSQWGGLATVQKQDAGLAKRLAGMNDVYKASRELSGNCEQYQKMCDQLVSENHAYRTVDGVKVGGAALTIMILNAPKGSSAATVPKKGGGF